MQLVLELRDAPLEAVALPHLLVAVGLHHLQLPLALQLCIRRLEPGSPTGSVRWREAASAWLGRRRRFNRKITSPSREKISLWEHRDLIGNNTPNGNRVTFTV
jgi:hypothetical protein